MKTLRKINQIGTVAYVSGIPYLPEKFLASYSQMREYNALHLGSVYYTRETSSWIPRARNEITGQIRGDWLFFLDTDLTFDPDCLEQMLRIMNKYEAPVVTGFYVQKKKPHLPILSSWNEEKKVYEIDHIDNNRTSFDISQSFTSENHTTYNIVTTLNVYNDNEQ